MKSAFSLRELNEQVATSLGLEDKKIIQSPTQLPLLQPPLSAKRKSPHG